MGYDQWKTASPYDDDIDPIEEAERFIKDNEPAAITGEPVEVNRAYHVVEGLLEYIDNEV